MSAEMPQNYWVMINWMINLNENEHGDIFKLMEKYEDVLENPSPKTLCTQCHM